MNIYYLHRNFEGPLHAEGHPNGPVHVPALDNIEMLDCFQTPLLTALPSLKNITRLECSQCTSLTEIPFLENLVELRCSGCVKLKEIAVMPTLKTLDCSNCLSLTKIPFSENIMYLQCFNCPLITEIPLLKDLLDLVCSNCPLITSIPFMENIEMIDCSDCKWITTIPDRFYYCDQDNCPCLPVSDDYDRSIMERLIQVQRWYKKRYFWRRLIRLVYSEPFLKLYYQPGHKGYWISMKNAGRLLDKST